jgi:hypothetical protein
MDDGMGKFENSLDHGRFAGFDIAFRADEFQDEIERFFRENGLLAELFSEKIDDGIGKNANNRDNRGEQFGKQPEWKDNFGNESIRILLTNTFGNGFAKNNGEGTHHEKCQYFPMFWEMGSHEKGDDDGCGDDRQIRADQGGCQQALGAFHNFRYDFGVGGPSFGLLPNFHLIGGNDRDFRTGKKSLGTDA